MRGLIEKFSSRFRPAIYAVYVDTADVVPQALTVTRTWMPGACWPRNIYSVEEHAGEHSRLIAEVDAVTGRSAVGLIKKEIKQQTIWQAPSQ